MKKSTRILSLILCLLLCISLCPAAAFAEDGSADFSEAEEFPAEAAANMPEDEPAAEEVPSGSLEDTVFNDAGCSASIDYEVQVSGTYHQTEARSMLASINAFRTGDEAWYWNYSSTQKVYCSGLSELTYDYTLEKDAMQRAAEIAVYYSHTRPNGDSCYTARTGSYSYAGENIAYGGNCLTTAEEAFTAWREDDYTYSGQGHRRNMLSSSFNRIGVACFQYNYSVDYTFYYWVQEFSYTTDANTATIANDSVAVVDIYMNSDLISSVTLNASPASYKLSEEESSDLPVISAKITVADSSCSSWNEYSATVTAVSPSFTVSDSSVLNVSGSSLTGLKKGDASLICTALGSSISVPVTVYGKGEMPYPESEHNYANNANDTQTYTVPGASSLTAVFSSSSCTEQNYDYVYIYDGSGNPVGTFHGNFGGQSVTVPGNTMKVVLTSDGSNVFYGYSFDSITAAFPGDVTGDGSINTADLAALKSALANNTVPMLQDPDSADMNIDGSVNLKDLLLLKRQLIG